MRISDWSSDVCSSDLLIHDLRRVVGPGRLGAIGGGALGAARERNLFDTVMPDEDDKRVLGLLLGGEDAASRYDSVLLAGQGAQLVVIVVLVLVHLAFPLGDCRLDLDQLRGFFLGRMALASGFQMAAHPVGIRPVELPFCIAPAIFARRLGDGVEPILHKVHDKARIIAVATFSEKIGGEGAACGAIGFLAYNAKMLVGIGNLLLGEHGADLVGVVAGALENLKLAVLIV